MKKRTRKKRKMVTYEDLLDFVSTRYNLDKFWSWWLVEALEKQAENCETTMIEYCKSPQVRHFVSGFLAARSMQTVVDQHNN
jgi:hypothetical protein